MLFSPKKTAKEHMSLLTSITVKVEHNESHAPAAAVSLTDKVVRTCSSALLRQLVNTKVSQFICHVMGCRLTRALHAAWLVCICEVFIFGLFVVAHHNISTASHTLIFYFWSTPPPYPFSHFLSPTHRIYSPVVIQWHKTKNISDQLISDQSSLALMAQICSEEKQREAFSMFLPKIHCPWCDFLFLIKAYLCLYFKLLSWPGWCKVSQPHTSFNHLDKLWRLVPHAAHLLRKHNHRHKKSKVLIIFWEQKTCR